MIKVANQKCIRHLGMRCMRAAKTRNIVAIVAIILTTVLFTSMFTIAQSFGVALQESTFRAVGGYSHASLKYITLEQTEEFREDPLIQEYGLRRFVGIAEGTPFQKSQVEISWCDENEAKWGYRMPTSGHLPTEGTNEAAMDTKVLALLGIEPNLGEEVTITMDVDGESTTQTFILCGWWEHDDACEAIHVLIPESRVNAIFDELNTQGLDGMTTYWNMSIMFADSADIYGDMMQILKNHGYQNEAEALEHYIAIGVNWGYLNAQINNNMSASALIVVIPLALLIIFTGYLIIYNIFQISVVSDIRFYGLLKTIGTTPKQIRRIIRQQALLLCAIGIPLGLVIGWLLGVRLTPVILTQLEGIKTSTISANPLIFLFSTLFSIASGYLCFIIVSKFLGISIPKQYEERFENSAEVEFSILRTAKELHMKSKAGKISLRKLQTVKVPVIAKEKTGEYLILLKYQEEQWTILDPKTGKPEIVSTEALSKRLDGYVMIFGNRKADAANSGERFGFRWFIPTVLKFKKQFICVQLAVFMIQILGILTPLMTQVVVDKVLSHHAISTLNTIAVGILIAYVYELIISLTKNYLFVHTTNRIDVILSARLFHHLFALPLKYFESRRVGETVARVKELDTIRSFLTGTPLSSFIDFLFIIVYIVVLFFYSVPLSIIVVAAIPIFALLSFIVTPLFKKTFG